MLRVTEGYSLLCELHHEFSGSLPPTITVPSPFAASASALR